jgi:glutamate synthase (NADPH/NADH) small chain
MTEKTPQTKKDTSAQDAMQQFVSIPYATPVKKAPEERQKNFKEIYTPFSPPSLNAQSSRCEQCGIPMCQSGCPLHNNIPDWLLLATQKRWQEAYHIASLTNDLPEICGRICPQDRLCEEACVLEISGHDTVTIGSIEAHITEKAWKKGFITPIKPHIEQKESVAIIGSGPAGLAAAIQLRKKGYQVSIYERNDRPGGLLTYGIPSFKLEKHIVERRIQWLKESRVSFFLNTAVGSDISFDDIRKKYHAVLIATGVYKPSEIQCPGTHINGIVPALEYLTTSNRLGMGDTIPQDTLKSLHAQDKNVTVIGGGDTAMDCVRTAIRQGAKSVQCLYRRDRNNMPGSQREVANAEEEGVQFLWLTNPLEFKEKNQHISHIVANHMQLENQDKDGRQQISAVPNSEHNINSSMAILALGFTPEHIPSLLGNPSIEIQNWGTIKVQGDSQETSLEGVYAAGDIVRGASLVVWAVKEGRQAAFSIHSYLQQKKELKKTG